MSSDAYVGMHICIHIYTYAYSHTCTMECPSFYKLDPPRRWREAQRAEEEKAQQAMAERTQAELICVFGLLLCMRVFCDAGRTCW